METFLELLKLGSVGVIAGLFSSYIANRDHRHKKWWELRVVAYQDLIEALSDLNHYFGSMYKAEIENSEMSEEHEKELRKYWDSSYHKIRLAADSGAFLYSDEVNDALKDFMNMRNARHDTWFEYLDENLVIVEKCLNAVVSLSKNDLKVKSSWL
jgi:hypothetical protein